MVGAPLSLCTVPDNALQAIMDLLEDTEDK